MSRSFEVSLAPEKLWQAINPLTFYQQGAQLGLVNINLGQTAYPEIERDVLDEVGSYGRQLGRIGDALEVIVRHMPLDTLDQEERDQIDMLLGQLAAIRRIKARERG